jgi:hypothetical protein
MDFSEGMGMLIEAACKKRNTQELELRSDLIERLAQFLF